METPRSIVIVEGTSDSGVISNLWKRHSHGQVPFEIDVRFGIDNLREAFTGYLVGSGVGRLGVVVDADNSVQSRWQGFYQKLVERGYRPVAKTLSQDGLVLYRPDRVVPIVGVWVMPDNLAVGGLEEFVRYLVRPDDPLWAHADAILNGIPEDLRRFKLGHRSKAQVYTWLAWQKEPGLRLGPAIERRLLDPDAEHALRFVSWLRRLFVEDPAPVAL